MDPLAKATCHISIRAVLGFWVSCRPKVYESLLEDSFQISLQGSLFWHEANRRLMRTRSGVRNRSVNFEISLSSQRHLTWWTKDKNQGLHDRISNWPCAKRTWRVVQNGFLVWKVFGFSAHPKDGKAATPQVNQINMWKRVNGFSMIFLSTKISSTINISVEKMGKDLMLEDLHRCFFSRYGIRVRNPMESPQIQRKDEMFCPGLELCRPFDDEGLVRCLLFAAKKFIALIHCLEVFVLLVVPQFLKKILVFQVWIWEQNHFNKNLPEGWVEGLQFFIEAPTRLWRSGRQGTSRDSICSSMVMIQVRGLIFSPFACTICFFFIAESGELREFWWIMNDYLFMTRIWSIVNYSKNFKFFFDFNISRGWILNGHQICWSLVN